MSKPKIDNSHWYYDWRLSQNKNGDGSYALEFPKSSKRKKIIIRKDDYNKYQYNNIEWLISSLYKALLTINFLERKVEKCKR